MFKNIYIEFIPLLLSLFESIEGVLSNSLVGESDFWGTGVNPTLITEEAGILYIGTYCKLEGGRENESFVILYFSLISASLVYLCIEGEELISLLLITALLFIDRGFVSYVALLINYFLIPDLFFNDI